MKGLLLKDWYMMKKYCRAYFLIAGVFIVASIVSTDNLFFVFYTCLICGMIPVTLLGYDERSRWLQYSATMPYTRAQIVSAKYLIGLFAQVAMLFVTGIVLGTKMVINGDFVFGEFTVLMLLLLTMSTLSSSISLPFIFKFGMEKGRIAYYVMIGIVCGAGSLASNLFKGGMKTEIRANTFLIVLSLIGIGFYALSWYLSIAFYRKREIQ